ncbi:MAG TPA: hypothetical protein VM492_07950 [Sumerlaeia bacterium]|nr:hypothetical protein [Sumerlaeia bacterium]
MKEIFRARALRPVLLVVGLLVSLACSPALAQDLSDSIQGVAEKMKPSRVASGQDEADQVRESPAPEPQEIADEVREETQEQGEEGTLPAAPGQVAGDREIDEADPKTFLRDNPVFRKIIAEDAEFIYNPRGREDPMTLPWTRDQVKSKELMEIAEYAIASKKWDEARSVFTQIMELVAALSARNLVTGDLEQARAEAIEGLTRVSELETEAREAEIAAKAPEDRPPELPNWVRIHTSGVIVDAKEPYCVVGEFILKINDLVPGQAEDILVKHIERDVVLYEVRGTPFPVRVQEGE